MEENMKLIEAKTKLEIAKIEAKVREFESKTRYEQKLHDKKVWMKSVLMENNMLIQEEATRIGLLSPTTDINEKIARVVSVTIEKECSAGKNQQKLARCRLPLTEKKKIVSI